MPEYTAPITVNPCPVRLTAELDAALAPRVVTALAFERPGIDQVRATTDEALDAGQQATLASVVAAHAGKVPVAPRPILHATGKFAGKQEAITSVDAWQDLGDRIITTPGWFCRGGFMLINAVAQCRGNGTGAELRLVEDPGRAVGGHRLYDGADERVLVSAPIALPDTANAWWDLDWMTDLPLTLTARCEYRLQGRLGVTGSQAISAHVRICDAALLELP